MQIMTQDQITGALDGAPAVPSALALGFFDGVHKGHTAVVGAAVDTAHGKGLRAVAVTFAGNPRGVPLLLEPEEKHRALAELGVELLVELQFPLVRGLSPEMFVRDILTERLGARKVFCGFNYRFGRDAAGDAKTLAGLCMRYGAEARALPPVCSGGEPVSSTRIRGLLMFGRVEDAAALLGRPFGIRGEVVHGKKLGRTLGFPTINQIPFAQMVQLRQGVYASFAMVEGRRMPAVTNIGSNPTVGGRLVTWETYIPGFDGDLYGRHVEVSLRRFLRDEQKFDTLEEMRTQIFEDARQSLAPVRESSRAE